MNKIKAKDAFWLQLNAQGVSTIFGNPGTVEESILDTLSDYPAIEYVHGLQESIVLAMADGYARTSKMTAVAQLHSAVGLGNAISILYQAHRSFTPMVVFAGEAHYDLQPFDGFLAGDLVEIAKPVTKWSARVTSGNQLLRMLRRAFKVSITPPQGPVFLALPMNVLEEEIEADIYPASVVQWQTIPEHSLIEQIANVLVVAESPLIIVGDGVSLSNATAETSELAGLLGSPIYGADFADLNIPFTDPLFMGLIGHSFGKQTQKITQNADVVLAIGTPVFPELFPSLDPYFKDGAKLIQIDINPWEIGKNFPIAFGVQCDPKLTLESLCRVVSRTGGTDLEKKAAQRKAIWEKQKSDQRDALDAVYDSVFDSKPISPSRLMSEVVNAMPPNTLVYDEAITSTPTLLHYLQPSDKDLYYLGRGGCIGVGWPGAIGAAIANPNRKVLALSGDGSALYIVQCLWTAAKYNLNIVFLVCNNESYRILKVNLLQYWSDQSTEPRKFPESFDLDNPPINFVDLARGFGILGRQVTDADGLAEELDRAFQQSGPYLLDVVIDGKI